MVVLALSPSPETAVPQEDAVVDEVAATDTEQRAPEGPDAVGDESAAPDGPDEVPTPEARTSPPAPTKPVAVEADAWKKDYVRVHPPRYRGTGLFIGAGAMIAATVGFQLIDLYTCGGCAGGFVERGMLGLAIGGATGAGVMRARSDAWWDAARGRTRDPRPYVITGSVLLGIGGAVAFVNEGFWWSCWAGGPGPYSVPDEYYPAIDGDPGVDGEQWYACRYGLPQALADGAGTVLAAGGALLGYGLMLRRRQELFRGARIVSLTPTIAPGHAQLQVGGRF